MINDLFLNTDPNRSVRVGQNPHLRRHLRDGKFRGENFLFKTFDRSIWLKFTFHREFTFLGTPDGF